MSEIVTNSLDLRGEKFPLLKIRPGQENPQPAVILIDPISRKAEAKYRSDNSITEAEWNKRIIMIWISPWIRGKKISNFLESIRFQNLAKRICDGHERGIKGWHLNQDAEEALMELRGIAEIIGMK